MIEDIQSVQQELEGKALAMQPVIEKTAVELEKSTPALLTDYLTNYCVTNGEAVVKRWRELGEFLMTKYNDGYVKNERGRPASVGYPESWLRDVIKLRGDHFRLPDSK